MMKGVDCWVYDVTELADADRFSAAMARIPWEARREKVMRFRSEGDRRLCLGAGLLAFHALREAGASDLSIRRLEYGKPVLAAHPDIHFNLSHSGALAVCAVSDRPVGVDVQTMITYDPGLAARCLQPGERAWLEGETDRDRGFTRLWTRKESWLKRSGAGLSVPMRSFPALPGGSPDGDTLWAEHCAAGHLICVCACAGQEVRFRPWPPAR